MKEIKSGPLGEEYAANYLLKKGYKICERNFRCRTGEIDIIAMDKSCLVFTEVKTRKSDICGRPAEFVTAKKQEKLRKAAFAYINNINEDEPEMRFDVIEVFYEIYRGEFFIRKVNHIENAF